MRLFKTLIFCISLLAIACGSGEDGGEDVIESDTSKELFSFWHDTSDNSPLNLSGGDFGVEMIFYMWAADGSQCNCNFQILGDQSSGNYVINNCSYVSGSGAGDPGCDSINQTGTYTKSSDTLTTCNSTMNCDTYQ